MNCSLAERNRTATGREEAVPVPPLVAWVRRHLPDAAVWPPQRGPGKEDPSTGANELGEEFRLAILQPLVVQLGSERFGPPSAEVRAAIETITDLDQLVGLAARVQAVASWDELLAG